jgi:hypothetical protein
MTNPISSQPRAPKQRLRLLSLWLFPYLLAAGAYGLGFIVESAVALRSPVFTWPIHADIYGWLLLMVLLSGAWLIGEFVTVTNRETIVVALQSDAVVSALTAMAFTGVAGWQIGTSGLQWWLVVPWVASVLDAMISAWLGINNAAQKPFLSHRGSM